MIMINDFLQYLQYEKNFSLHTVVSYRNDLSQFVQYLKDSKPAVDGSSLELIEPELSSVTSDQIRAWVMQLMEQGISARSVARKISSLRSFWKFLLIRGLTDKDPLQKVVLPKTKKPLPVFFREKEVREVIEDPFATDQFETVRNLLIIEMLYTTGVRLSELISIREIDLDIEKGELRVTGKRNKQRIIPLHSQLCEKIHRYLQLRNQKVPAVPEDQYFLVKRNGQKLYPKLVYRVVHEIMSSVSSLEKVSPHVMRHSFATGMLNGGADIHAVRELLGHSSLAATQVYTHTGFEELHTIYKQAHPRAK